MLYACGEGLHLFSPADDEANNWRRKARVEIEVHRRPKLRPLLLKYDGAIYNPGAHWRRIDPQTWRVERLTGSELPAELQFEHYGVSAHYGLVAWELGGRFYRVSIDSEAR